MENKFKVHKYLDTILEQTDEKVVVATLESNEIGIARFVLPADSQIAMRAKYYVDNGIKDFLESGLSGNVQLVDLNDFKVNNQTNRFGESEKIFFHKSFNGKPTSNKVIHLESIQKLEFAFDENLSLDKLFESNILCQLESEDGDANIYLISKFKNEDKFIAIVEHEFSEKREIEIITYENIRELGIFAEKVIKPFSVRAFIETGIKEIQSSDIETAVNILKNFENLSKSERLSRLIEFEKIYDNLPSKSELEKYQVDFTEIYELLSFKYIDFYINMEKLKPDFVPFKLPRKGRLKFLYERNPSY